jgi:hypothetical protein
VSDPRNFDLTKIRADSLEWKVFVAARKFADLIDAASVARAAIEIGAGPGITPDQIAELDRRAAEAFVEYTRAKSSFWKAKREGRA